MIKKTLLLVWLVLGINQLGFSQTVNNTLIKADKLFIKQEFDQSAKAYEHYLKSHPKDYYASRQAAICYKKTNDQYKAIDYWPDVVESSNVTDKDRLEYAKCLLTNYRVEEARKLIKFLNSSPDKAVAAWGAAYSNFDQFYLDSAICKVTEVKGNNSTSTEYCPIVINDKLIFISEKNKANRDFIATGNENNCAIRIASKVDDASYLEAKLYANKIQNKGVSGQISVSSDENTIYYSRSVSSKKLGAENEATFYKFQIYSSGLEKSEENAFKYNSMDYDCMHPCISKDGLKLYFASDMKGTLGGKDIFVCEWIDGTWSTPKNLGESVNTSGDEVFPQITENGTLFFASDTRPGLGGLDIFYAEPNSTDGTFLNAKNAGNPINTQFDDYGLYLLKGGKTGYFSSNRKNNLQDDDIYYFKKEKPL